MDYLTRKRNNALRRAYRVRSSIESSSTRPRLSINISNMHVTAQIIDDSKSKTLAYVTTVGQKINGNMSDKATWVGHEIAKKAKTAKVKQVVLDRGSRKYHGRIKVLAEVARKDGLEF